MLFRSSGVRGLYIDNSSTNLSGGNSTAGYTNLSLGGNGATFSNGNGIPVQVHGVAGGTAPTDAVNVSQLNQGLNGLKAGVASTVAMANIPQVDQGKRFAVGMGIGHYDGASALSVGGSIRVNENAVIKGSLGHSFNTSGSADTSTAIGVGAAYSW